MLLDLNMPGCNGADLWRVLERQGYTFPVVILTAEPGSPLLQGLHVGGLRVLAKPMTIEELKSTIRDCGLSTFAR